MQLRFQQTQRLDISFGNLYSMVRTQRNYPIKPMSSYGQDNSQIAKNARRTMKCHTDMQRD
ncbi:hypothetical protein LINPERHAP1_LOCUS31734 [Linum perenne]